MEKTDKSTEEMYLYWVDQMQPKGTNCSTEDEITIYRAMDEYAAQQLSEYKEVIKELLPFTRSVVYNTSISTEEGRKNVREIQAIIDRAKKLIEK